MALNFGLDFSDLFSHDESETSSKGFEDSTVKTTGEERVSKTIEQQQTGSESSVGTHQQTTTLLGEDVQQAITGVILALSGGLGGDSDVASQANEIAGFLFERAKGAEAAIAENTAAIVGEQRRVGERELTRLSTDLATAAGGSRANSFVMGATAEGRAALESQLASLQAQLNIQGRQVMTQELVSALQGLATGAGAGATQAGSLANLVNSLRGATSTTIGTTTQDTLREQRMTGAENILTLLSQLVEGRREFETETESESGGGLLSAIF